jgi:23S rRNA (adenine2503-C2)-methyltransferase
VPLLAKSGPAAYDHAGMANENDSSSLPLLSGSSAEADAVRRHLCGCTPDDLRTWLMSEGHERYRADQLLEWVFQRDAHSFDQMSNLSKQLRGWLAARADILRGTVVRQSVSEDGTQKLVLRWPDGGLVETVWIPDGDRHTVCLSSQVGCPVGCVFCASGLNGVERNLSAGEIVEQALRVRALIREATDDPQARLTNIVMMGMGEPLANYAAVVSALRILNAEWGLGIGARKITVSTVGLPKQIRQLARENLQLNLALSLHAPDDELRRTLIPWGKMPIPDLLDACEDYFRTTGREITLEYILLRDVNMTSAHAQQLARIARRLRANVNLLRYNPVPGLPYRRPNSQESYAFQAQLRDLGVNAHIRTSRGRDIDAACGQLRRKAADPGG